MSYIRLGRARQGRSREILGSGGGQKEFLVLLYNAIYNAAVTFKTGGSVLAENIEGV